MKRFMNLSLIISVIAFLGACSSVPMAPQGSKPEYNTQFNPKDKTIGDIEVAKFVKGAPLRVIGMVHVDQPPKKAWKISLVEIDKWSNGDVETVRFVNTDKSKKGIRKIVAGSNRKCMKGDDLIYENIRYIDHDKMMYVYSVNKDKTNVTFPAANHTGIVTVEDDGKGGSLITFRAHYDRSWHPLSIIFPPLFRSRFHGYMATIAKVYGGEAVKSKFHR